MYIDEFREYCLSKIGVTEEQPFGPDTLVFKVGGKMFALTGLDEDKFAINLKADPEKAIQQREKYTCIRPGFHMNKKHWNTIYVREGGIADNLLYQLIDDSYDLVHTSLSKVIKQTISI